MAVLHVWIFIIFAVCRASAVDDCRRIGNATAAVYNGTCLYIFREDVYWVQAYGKCREKGTDLAQIYGQNVYKLLSSEEGYGSYWTYGGQDSPCMSVKVVGNRTSEEKTKCTTNQAGFLCQNEMEITVPEVFKHKSNTPAVVVLSCVVSILMISLVVVIIICRRPIIQRQVLYDVPSATDDVVYDEPRIETQNNYTLGTASAITYHETKRRPSKDSQNYEKPVTLTGIKKGFSSIFKFRFKGREKMEIENEIEHVPGLKKDQIEVIYKNTEQEGGGGEYMSMDPHSSQEKQDTPITQADVYQPMLYENQLK